MSDDDKLKELVEKLNKKLKDPEIKKEVTDAIEKIEEIFETEIDISIIFNETVNDYKELFSEYDLDDVPDLDDVLTLGHLKTVLDEETDDELKIGIDPIYLKEKGINNISDLIITTFEDKIILVPKGKYE